MNCCIDYNNDKNDDGCCCTNDCCNEPNIYPVEHHCGVEDCLCDANWCKECYSCGCYCPCDV